MKEEFKKGTKFTVCSIDELLKKGWTEDRRGYFVHSEFPGSIINPRMIKDHQGETLTVVGRAPIDVLTTISQWWYTVEENKWQWPIATFIEETEIHACKEGMTPIDGWFICKICGTNLSTVKS